MDRPRKRNADGSPDSRTLKKPCIVIDERAEDGDAENDLVEQLSREGFGVQVCQAFKDNEIRFDHLVHIKKEDLANMGISQVGTQIDLLKCLSRLRIPMIIQQDEKVFNDPIHGHIELHPLLIEIIDTPQFQRLRYIKQLGGGYFVFPGASHNRFEHSIGVAYLAGEFIESISRRQPELNVTESDILCIKIAGLCHDLGHGPFSHMFDGEFIPKATGCKDWRHEEGSVMMLEHLIKCNDLWPRLEQNGLSKDDLIFIRELIVGPIDISDTAWPYKGRDIEKSFLYEIVANKRTGIDVDKWDYFARDCHCLGIPNNFDWKRYTKFARVLKVNDSYQICCRDKEVTNLYEMFHTRASLHRRAYKHKTSSIVEAMITEALLKADEHLSIPGKDDKPVRISQAIHDPYAYTNLNDSIIFNILQSTLPELAASRKILNQLHQRQLYKCIGQTQPSAEFPSNEDVLSEQIINSCTPMNGKPQLTVEDIVVKVISFDYGMKDKNPIDEMRFYTKQNPSKGVKVHKDQVSQMLPHIFIEKTMRVYCKKLDNASLRMARRCFAEWCANQDPNFELRGSQLEETENYDELEEFQFTPYGTPFGTPMKVDGNEDSDTSNQTMEQVKKNLSKFFS